jgi:uncharacterized RDD family membrane protein YckC
MSLAAPRARAVAARVHGVETEPPPLAYEGLVTRAIAFAVDAALINLAAILVGLAVGLAASVLGTSAELDKALLAIGGVAFAIWTAAYFVTFWSTTGQTPGNRLMQIRVCRADDGAAPRPFKALQRLIWLVLAALPLFAGLLPILVDDRRRGLHDMLAGTVVVDAPAARRPVVASPRADR